MKTIPKIAIITLTTILTACSAISINPTPDKSSELYQATHSFLFSHTENPVMPFDYVTKSRIEAVKQVEGWYDIEISPIHQEIDGKYMLTDIMLTIPIEFEQKPESNPNRACGPINYLLNGPSADCSDEFKKYDDRLKVIGCQITPVETAELAKIYSGFYNRMDNSPVWAAEDTAGYLEKDCRPVSDAEKLIGLLAPSYTAFFSSDVQPLNPIASAADDILSYLQGRPVAEALEIGNALLPHRAEHPDDLRVAIMDILSFTWRYPESKGAILDLTDSCPKNYDVDACKDYVFEIIR